MRQPLAAGGHLTRRVTRLLWTGRQSFLYVRQATIELDGAQGVVIAVRGVV